MQDEFDEAVHGALGQVSPCDAQLFSSSSVPPAATPAVVPIDEARIEEGDFVLISGGGVRRVAEVRKGVQLRLGRAGSGLTSSLVGMRYGEVVELNHHTHRFVASDSYPDLDLTTERTAEETKDNRGLQDDNQSQRLSNVEVATLRKERSMSEFLSTLVENSATFQTKTNFAQEKYLRKKQKKYGVLYKVERVVPDNLAEVHLPTINPSDTAPEEGRSMRLRADTVALLLHHADVHEGSRVLAYDKTNGLLEAYLLTRLGATGQVWQLLDRAAQPNTFTAAKVMCLPAVKERWRAVPRNEGFLLGTERVAEAKEQGQMGASADGPHRLRQCSEADHSQWLRGIDARVELLRRPADSLVIVDDDAPGEALRDLLPFVACGGHVTVYSNFLDSLTELFAGLRATCVNVRLSETWYRHHQVMPQRTHPTVNMSTAGGYLLTAIKVEPQRTTSSVITGVAERVCEGGVTACDEAVDDKARRERKRSRSPDGTDVEVECHD